MTDPTNEYPRVVWIPDNTPDREVRAVQWEEAGECYISPTIHYGFPDNVRPIMELPGHGALPRDDNEPEIAEMEVRYHVYLHDTQERLTLLASGPRQWAITYARRWLENNEPDSEAKIVLSRVEWGIDAGDFMLAFRYPGESHGSGT